MGGGGVCLADLCRVDCPFHLVFHCAGLLHRDPLRRLGYRGAGEIKAHPFFDLIDWGMLQTGQVQFVFYCYCCSLKEMTWGGGGLWPVFHLLCTKQGLSAPSPCWLCQKLSSPRLTLPSDNLLYTFHLPVLVHGFDYQVALCGNIANLCCVLCAVWSFIQIKPPFVPEQNINAAAQDTIGVFEDAMVRDG